MRAVAEVWKKMTDEDKKVLLRHTFIHRRFSHTHWSIGGLAAELVVR